MNHHSAIASALLAFFAASAPLAASAQATPNTAQITFTPPTTLADGSPIGDTSTLGYNLYQGVKGAPKTAVAFVKSSPVNVTTGLAIGNTYCFQLSAVLNGIEGALSNEACKSFIAPGTFVIKVN